MRHFAHFATDQRDRLFLHAPQPFDRTADRDVLATALGATLYMPATRPALAEDLLRQGASGVVSSVLCLEDAIADDELESAEANVVQQLVLLGQRLGVGEVHPDAVPLTFVRVRAAEQITRIVDRLGPHAAHLSGFVLPKFTAERGPAFLAALTAAREASGAKLWAMPVIESPEHIHLETRADALLGVRALLATWPGLTLAVRLGATDLCSVFGIRRGRDLTVYDVRPVAEVLSDVVNVLARADGTGYVVTGPVWEYFSGPDRIFKSQLRQTPFAEQDENRLRHQLVAGDLDGLIREVVLDRANGLTGKTVIHPSHVVAVHALSVVTHEEFCDATDIVGAAGSGVAGGSGGAMASSYRNKMNETKPHRAWAERTLRRAAVFGVANEDVGFVDLLSAGLS